MIKACDDNGYDDDNHDDNDILDIVTASLLMDIFRTCFIVFHLIYVRSYLVGCHTHTFTEFSKPEEKILPG